MTQETNVNLDQRGLIELVTIGRERLFDSYQAPERHRVEALAMT